MNTVNASNLLFLLALGLLFGGVRDGDVERGPQRCQVAAAERGLAGMAGLFYRSANGAEMSLRNPRYLQQSLQLLDLLREEFRNQLFCLFEDHKDTHSLRTTMTQFGK